MPCGPKTRPKGRARFVVGKPRGLLRIGNIDLYRRPSVKAPEGGCSSVRSVFWEIDGVQVLMPTVVGNRVVSDKTALREFFRTGRHLGIFNSIQNAKIYSRTLHLQQARIYQDCSC